MATSQTEVGVRDLKNQLSRYLERVRAGEDIIVTDRGRPVARISALEHSTDRLDALISSGAVRPPKGRARHRPSRRVAATSSVSELVADQRR